MKVSSEFSRNWKTDCLWFLPVSFWLTVSRIPVVLFGVIAFAAALVQLALNAWTIGWCFRMLEVLQELLLCLFGQLLKISQFNPFICSLGLSDGPSSFYAAISGWLYWPLSLSFWMFDIWVEKNGLLEKYKLQGQKFINWDLAKRGVILTWLNGWTTVALRSWLIYTVSTDPTRFAPIYFSSTAWYVYVIKFFLILFFADVVFYTTHRIMHFNFLYPYIHKQHHQYSQPMAVSGVAAHPLDHFFINELTATIPPLLVGADFYVTVAWLLLGTLNGVVSHCGYKIPYLPLGADPHEYHHKYFSVEYGAGGWMDMFFKTRVEDVYPDVRKTRVA